jgi:hypothetical protein
VDATITSPIIGELIVLNGFLLAYPATGTSGGNVDRILLQNGGTGVYPYSIGVNNAMLIYQLLQLVIILLVDFLFLNFRFWCWFNRNC